MTTTPRRLKDEFEGSRMGHSAPRTRRVVRDYNLDTRDYDLDEFPGGQYDERVWDLVIAFRDACLELGIQLRTPHRLAYAMLQRRLSESRVRDLVEACELQMESTTQVPVWSKIVRLIMLLFIEDYITIGKESWAWEQMLDPDTWGEIQTQVVSRAISEDIVQASQDDPGEPAYKAERQIMKPSPARPRRGRFNGDTPENHTKINWRKK